MSKTRFANIYRKQNYLGNKVYVGFSFCYLSDKA